ncbi:E3 ubiquitin-protein ligase RBBP6 [Drosophila yakuba]|uniref:Uncharacterized protein, isoform A n=1 Tax=Drosophila yakuba TaxID=7245 RepID=B4PAU2_DROYA|nr:E3 ubiquitin-protein ligase RBBP6 [Drosophila yakuba]XP_015051653.1 E3 ubiquitin-protein ligase RBBP6 [Drosophila yakuba]EDW92482.1 uncharacterized protein Dyak_GE14378, isoform A [Drosophila yakuba]KRK00545.1 uncharacterized protein Dyak_GE14378, isoform B [Drosophila yakuba]
MSVHYKFKSTLNFDTITFDGLHISVGDLKREIVQQKRLGKIIDFDLQITNAQSKEEYKDDGVLIPKNTTLIISRIPIAHPAKKGWEPPAAENAFSAAPAKQDNFNMDLSKMQGTEEDKIQAMMMQSTVDYDPKTYHRIKGQSQVGEVPASYRCNKCKKSGHWIKNCPFVTGKDQQEVKRNTGIPRSFRDKPDAAENESSDFVLPAVQNQEIPEDLICGICRDIFVDAVMIPCCGSSFCDDCVRTSLLESEDSECPDCKEKNCSPGSLIPNRFLRNSVNAFKNETGYNKSAAKPAAAKTEEKPPVEKEVEEKPVAEEEPEKTEVKPGKQQESETNGSNPPKSESPEPPPTTEPSQKEKDKYDSDYEDNITIKMPQPAADSASVPSKRSPSYSQRSESSHRRDRSDYVSEHDHKHHRPSKSESANKDRSLLPTPIGTVPSYQGHMMAESEEARRSSAYKPPYMQMQRGPPPMHMMGHHMPAYNNGYNNMGQRPPLSYVPYQNQAVHPMRTPYGAAGGGMNMNMSQPFQSPNLASIYQGVAAKVGSGLIDDPLEAFNRIMKEKERKKVDRFRSSDRHRSRSPDRQRHRFKSPMYDKDNSRDNLKDKRPRSRERKREHSYERHIRHPRSSRQPNDGSKSPGGRIKRSGHRRSASPKPGYKSDYRDKPYNKPSAPKPEPVEPPPPGFEPLQLTDEDGYRNKHPTTSEASQSSKAESIKKRDNRHEEAPRKRHRSRSKSKEPKPTDSSYRSLTPPAKITTPKMTAAQLRERECTPKTPERAHDDYLPARARIMASQPDINDSEMETNVGKENKAKSPLSKDRKKKKKDKDKADRKKSKKDKRARKEKGDRQKKSSSVNRSDSDINNSSLANEPNYKVSSPRASSNFEINAAQLSPAHNATENVSPKKSHSFLNVSVASDDNLGPRSKLSEANSVNLSKWEMEENILSLEDATKKSAGVSDDPSEITSDVLRKAENAIFAKAINAIRPVEFQVIINSKDNSKDRSVIRNDKDRSPSPRRTSSKSVKERLGNKISNDRSRSPDKSKGRRREAITKSSDDDANRGRSDRHGSRKRDNRSRDRTAPSEKRQERSSYKRRTPEDDRNRRQNKERSDSKHGKHDQINSDDSDRRTARNTKSSDSRVVSSVTAVAVPPKPCRPDNPFRKFVDNSSSSSLVVKYDNTIQNDGASSDNGMEHRKQRDKKLKKHSKYSSTESLRSEKRKDLKSKKKSKILKKKKKSKK